MEGNLPPLQYTPDQKLFCVMSKNKGATTDQIRQEFSEKWPTKNPPTRKSIFNFEKQLNEEKLIIMKYFRPIVIVICVIKTMI